MAVRPGNETMGRAHTAWDATRPAERPCFARLHVQGDALSSDPFVTK